MVDLGNPKGKYTFAPHPWNANEVRSGWQHWSLAVGDWLWAFYVFFGVLAFINYEYLQKIGCGASCLTYWFFIATIPLAALSLLLGDINSRICSSCKKWGVGEVIWSDTVDVDSVVGYFVREVWRCRACGHEWKIQQGSLPG